MKGIFSNQCGENMGWLALDDTDHLGGGCTTYTLFELIQNLPDGYTASEFRLVRLYPFARQRTRGARGPRPPSRAPAPPAPPLPSRARPSWPSSGSEALRSWSCACQSP